MWRSYGGAGPFVHYGVGFSLVVTLWAYTIFSHPLIHPYLNLNTRKSDNSTVRPCSFEDPFGSMQSTPYWEVQLLNHKEFYETCCMLSTYLMRLNSTFVSFELHKHIVYLIIVLLVAWQSEVVCHMVWTLYFFYQLGVGLMIISLNLQIGDPKFKSQVGRVNRNFFKNPSPTVN